MAKTKKTVRQNICQKCKSYLFKTDGFKCRKQASDKFVKKCDSFEKAE